MPAKKEVPTFEKSVERLESLIQAMENGDTPLADLVAKSSETIYLKLPFQVPPLETFLYWHESTDSDQSNKWMRDLIGESYKIKRSSGDYWEGKLE